MNVDYGSARRKLRMRVQRLTNVESNLLVGDRLAWLDLDQVLERADAAQAHHEAVQALFLAVRLQAALQRDVTVAHLDDDFLVGNALEAAQDHFTQRVVALARLRIDGRLHPAGCLESPRRPARLAAHDG